MALELVLGYQKFACSGNKKALELFIGLAIKKKRINS